MSASQLEEKIRILAVADVMEAIASHRAALGIDAALEEIENNKGTRYDTRIVDTCLRIFRENGYQFKQT